MKTLEPSREPIVLAVERVALAMRYIVLAVLGVLTFAGELPWQPLYSAIMFSVVMGHNLFAHWVLWSRKHGWFVRRPNLALYTLDTTVIVWFTGVENSPAYVIFILVLAGLTAYTSGFRRILLVSMAFAGLYAFLIALSHAITGELAAPWGVIVANLLTLILAGWLLARINTVLRATEFSARERAQALVSSEATLRAILDNAADPIVVFAENELILEANDRACAFLGVNREELLGLRLRRFLFDDGTLSMKTASLRARGEFHGEQIIVTSDGEERTVEFVVRSFIRDGRRFFVSLARDVTDKKELYETTRLATANLERLNRELRQIDQLKTELLASIARKLRTPLAALLGNLEALLEEELGEVNAEQRSALLACRRSTLKMLRVMDDALHVRPPAAHSAEVNEPSDS